MAKKNFLPGRESNPGLPLAGGDTDHCTTRGMDNYNFTKQGIIRTQLVDNAHSQEA